MEKYIPFRLMALFVLLAMSLSVFSCEDEEKTDPLEQLGCVTGINKSGGTDRVFLYCCKRREFLAGSNTNAGGREIFKYYRSFEFKVVKSCSECQ